MQNQRFLLLFAFVLLICFNYSCKTEKEGTISGKVLSFSYGIVDTVGADAWLQIDDTKFIHSPHSYDWKNNLILESEKEEGYYAYLPTTRAFFYKPGVEKRYMEKIGSYNITSYLSKKLAERKEEGLVYQILRPSSLATQGKIIVKRRDNKKIKVKKSPDCPVIIQVEE